MGYHVESWMSLWKEQWYIDLKTHDCNILNRYFQHNPPANMLDIGCGLAWEARMFNQLYNTQLWLLDGDNNENKNKLNSATDTGYRGTADNFLFYNSLSGLEQTLLTLGTKDYTLLDCNNFCLPDSLTFDLIHSSLSCGFHYTTDTYKDLIKKHSHQSTKVIMDLRKKTVNTMNVEIVKVLDEGEKHIKAEIKFIEA